MTQRAIPTTIEALWQSYIDSLPEQRRPTSESIPEAWGFGHSPQMATGLGRLVYQGIKTATCSLYWAYEFIGEPLPQIGDLSIIIDGQGNPLCIIETTEVEIKAYNAVDSQFAYNEGEGDRSLAYWREVHWQAFAPECEAINRQPSENMPLVCERFRVLFKSPPLNMDP